MYRPIMETFHLVKSSILKNRRYQVVPYICLQLKVSLAKIYTYTYIVKSASYDHVHIIPIYGYDMDLIHMT